MAKRSTARRSATAGPVGSSPGASKVELPPKLRSEVARALGYYVYALVDPRDEAIFYVGKGRGSRAFAHQAEATKLVGTSGKVDRIRAILDAGLSPRVDIVVHGLPDEKSAFMVETALIGTLPQLTNKVAGQHADRAPLDELKVRYGAPDLAAAEPAMLVRLGPWTAEEQEIQAGYFRKGHGWRPDISPAELADSVRAWWRLNPQSVGRRGVTYAVGVYDGVTRCVLEIGEWIGPVDRRWAFHAEPITSGKVFEALVGPVGKRIPVVRGSQNPITYWP